MAKITAKLAKSSKAKVKNKAVKKSAKAKKTVQKTVTKKKTTSKSVVKKIAGSKSFQQVRKLLRRTKKQHHFF